MKRGFDAVFGNGAEVQRLINSIQDGTLPHALMIVGDEGAGKRTMALEIAMALNCENKGDGNYPLPCHSCTRCRRIKENNFTDVKRLTRAPDKASIGVEEVRLFKEDMYLSASEAEYKVYIFEEADTLTAQAQNALLIALEEPFPNVISLLLVSSGDSILSTIKSRARQITLERFSPDTLTEYFQKNDPTARELSRTDADKFRGIMLSARGSIGAAKRLLDPTLAAQNAEEREFVVRLLSSLSARGGGLTLHRTINELPKSRNELKPIFENIVLAIRDLTVLKHDEEAVLTFFARREEALELSRKFNQKKLLSIYDIVSSIIEDIERNANVTAMLTALAVKIKNS